MTNLNELEETVTDGAAFRGIDLTNLDIDAVESGALRNVLKLEYAPAEGDYSSASWSRTSYSRVVPQCRLIWP